MPSHTITDTTDGKTITAEEFHGWARRWAATVCIRRSMVNWLDEPIDRNDERLFDLAAEFWGDRYLVNFFREKKLTWSGVFVFYNELNFGLLMPNINRLLCIC